MDTFREIMDIWPTRVAFADVIGVKPNNAANMYARDSIDAQYFDAIVQDAVKRGRPDVTHELLCRIAAKKASIKKGNTHQENAHGGKYE